MTSRQAATLTLSCAVAYCGMTVTVAFAPPKPGSAAPYELPSGWVFLHGYPFCPKCAPEKS
jgi:hypothetical protein